MRILYKCAGNEVRKSNLCYTIYRGVIQLAEFCKCGSIIIGGRCTNKGCSMRNSDKPAAIKATTRKTAATEKVPAKTSNTRRSSKCITYNLYETKAEEGNN